MDKNESVPFAGFSQMQVSQTWGATGSVCWVDDGDVSPWLAAIWRCRETGDLDYRPLPIVKRPKSETPHEQ